MLYRFELSYNVTEATKTFVEWKIKGSVDHSTVTNDQASEDKTKTVDSEAVLRTLETNPASSTWRVSCELGIY